MSSERRVWTGALLLTFALVATPALATEGKAGKKDKAAKEKATAPKLDLGLGNLGGELPSVDGIEAKKATVQQQSPQITTRDVKFEVLEVVHAYDFVRTAQGTRPNGEILQEVGLYGHPPSTPKFATMVRVKATQNVNTSIELVILDPRGDTALSGSGELLFAGSKNGEVDWVIDWAPTARPQGGEFKLLVRIGGQPMGTWPLKVVASKN